MEISRERLRRWVFALLGLAVLGLAFEALNHELRSLHWAEVSAAVHAVPAERIFWALVLTAVNYFILTLYDAVAFAYVRKPLGYRRIAWTSFLAYAIANNVGFATLSGTSVRYRYYSRWGVTAGELSRVIVNYSTTFWLGLLVLGGLTLVLHPSDGAARVLGPLLARSMGFLLLALALAYAVLPFARRRAVRLWRFRLDVPAPRIVSAQFATSIADWLACAAVLHFLLPPSDLPFGALVGSFLVAQLVALVSHVPGGLGVFESLMLLALKPYHPAGTVLASLLLFRAVYYLLPFSLAAVLVVTDELRQRRLIVTRALGSLSVLSQAVTPRLLAVFTFAAGFLLLVSGATPAAPARLDWLSQLVPLPAIEISHFVGSLAGVGLLLLSHGVWRRLDASYYLTQALLATGMVSALFKGADYEEAVLLALLMAALLAARPWFDRKAAFLRTRIAPTWIAGVLAAVGASIWLGLFAYRHVEYAHELWWQFELDGHVSRFLRASIGVSVVLLVFGMRKFLVTAPPEMVPVNDAMLVDVERIVSGQSTTSANLVFLRDKTILFNAERSAFIMYGRQGRTWVVMGDPVGPAEAAPALIATFLERCDDFNGRPVFYEVAKERLHQYADLGLAFVKLGEEARIPLGTFTLEGSERKGLRMAHRRLTTDGGTFRVVPVDEVAPILDELEEVSNAWLRDKAVPEKGFSLGFFSRDYVRRFPIVVVEREGRIEAFANLWTAAADRKELSIDLMRHRDSPIRNLMEGLFVHLLVWAREQGYESFSLGMAPLSGLTGSPAASLWSKLATVVYQRGGALYNFQGLRTYKEKFHPVWEPRYLAFPGGLTLAPVLADVAALVAGGYRRMFFRR